VSTAAGKQLFAATRWYPPPDVVGRQGEPDRPESAEQESSEQKHALRAADEVEDHHDKQDDDEDPDQAVACPGDCDWHEFPFVVANVHSTL
jgi:hypothetical protein